MGARNKRIIHVPRYRAAASIPLKKGLVLQRYVGEKILIGDDVEVTLLMVEGAKTQIHVHAPANVKIDRPEFRGKRPV